MHGLLHVALMQSFRLVVIVSSLSLALTACAQPIVCPAGTAYDSASRECVCDADLGLVPDPSAGTCVLGDGGVVSLPDLGRDGGPSADADTRVEARDAAVQDADAASAPDASTFTPLQLPGLSLWLRADLGYSVGGWADQSGRGNDVMWRASADNDPTFEVPNDPAFGGQTSLAALGYGGFIADSPSLRFGTGDFAMFFVYATRRAEQQVIWDKRPGHSIEVGQRSVFRVTANAVGSPERPVDTRRATIAAVIRTGRRVEVSRGSLADSRTEPSPDDVDSLGTSIQLIGEGTSSFRGNIGEVLIIKGPLSETDRASLTEYFVRRYGLTRCAVESDCDNGLFCDGIERCEAASPVADERGCVAGPVACPNVACDENGRRCF